jgi:AhpD family alkylhydroperoxidase
MTQRVIIAKENPVAYKAMMGLEKFLGESSLSITLKELVKIRASQINGCAYCIDMHTKDARKFGESEKRIYLLNAWEDTDCYTAAERAALALTESITLISKEHVPDAVYQEAAQHFNKEQMGELIMAIVTINAWNRIAISNGLMPE